MNIQAWKNVFSKYCYNLHSAKINKFLSTSAKFYSKKQYRMKNKFTFRDDLKKDCSEKSKSKMSSRFLSEQNEYDTENNDSDFIHGFVSGDLLSPDVNRDLPRIM